MQEQRMESSTRVRAWEDRDSLNLYPLVLLYLLDVAKLRGDIAPSGSNAEAFIGLGYQALDRGDPCLVAEEGGKLVGFLIARGVDTSNLRTTKRICFGFGTYVLPEFRRMGFAKELRARAFEIAKAQGYERFQGVAYGQAAIDSALAMGSEALGVLVSKNLED